MKWRMSSVPHIDVKTKLKVGKWPTRGFAVVSCDLGSLNDRLAGDMFMAKDRSKGQVATVSGIKGRPVLHNKPSRLTAASMAAARDVLTHILSFINNDSISWEKSSKQLCYVESYVWHTLNESWQSYSFTFCSAGQQVIRKKKDSEYFVRCWMRTAVSLELCQWNDAFVDITFVWLKPVVKEKLSLS